MQQGEIEKYLDKIYDGTGIYIYMPWWSVSKDGELSSIEKIITKIIVTYKAQLPHAFAVVLLITIWKSILKPVRLTTSF